MNEIKASDNNVETYEDISDDEQDESYYNELRKVHVRDEPIELKFHHESYGEQLPEIMKVHLHDKSIELISDDELNNYSLSEIMKVHLQHKPNHLIKQQHHHGKILDNKMKVYVQDETHHVRNFNYLDSNLTTTTN